MVLCSITMSGLLWMVQSVIMDLSQYVLRLEYSKISCGLSL
jgi:hypothetical protein